jgi:hypothetical protein
MTRKSQMEQVGRGVLTGQAGKGVREKPLHVRACLVMFHGDACNHDDQTYDLTFPAFFRLCPACRHGRGRGRYPLRYASGARGPACGPAGRFIA